MIEGDIESLRILAVVGLLICAYFLNVYKGWMGPVSWLIPSRICRKNVCSDVLKTYFARVMVIPNFYWGMVYYGLVLIWSVMVVPFVLTQALMLLSWTVVIFSAYLWYALVFRLKVNCTLCFAAQVINVAIALLLTF